MPSPQYLELAPQFDQIVDWILFNPGAPTAEAARFFSRSQAWMANLIASDAFQARLEERAQTLGQLAIADLASRLNGVTIVALEKTLERLTSTENPPSEKFIIETTKNLTAILAAGALARRPGDTHLHLTVNPQTLEAARERASSLFRGAATRPAVEVHDAPQLPAGAPSGVCEANP